MDDTWVILRTVLSHHYGLSVERLEPERTAFRVVCRDGRQYFWKFVQGAFVQNRFALVCRAIRWLHSVGLEAAEPVRSRQGEQLIGLPDGRMGYLQRCVAGDPVRLFDRQQRLTAVANIAHVHGVCRPLIRSMDGGPLGVDFPGRLRAKCAFAERTLPQVAVGVPACADVVSEALRVVWELNRVAQTLTARNHAVDRWGRPLVYTFCHRDLAPHNQLWNVQTGRPILIDFDNAGIDHPFLDVMQLTNHGVFVKEPDPGFFRDIVEVYSRVQAVPDADAELLWQLLRFPDVLLRRVAEWIRLDVKGPEQARDVETAAAREQVRWRVWSQDRAESLRTSFAGAAVTPPCYTDSWQVERWPG